MEKQQTNWRDLPAGPELDELICRRVGWNVTTEPIGNTATLWNPKGEIVNSWGSSEARPDVVKIAWYNAPRFSRDADDALSLLSGLEMRWRLFGHGAGWFKCCIGGMGDEKGLTPALAVCRTWLAYQDWLAR